MQGEHKHIEDFEILKDKSVILIFDDGSYCYIDSENISNIIHGIIILTFDEELPFKDEEE